LNCHKALLGDCKSLSIAVLCPDISADRTILKGLL